jgi:multicomponent Na+:H+ antiporter subunit D
VTAGVLLPLAFAVPILAAALALVDRSGRLGRALGLVVPAALALAGASLVWATKDGQVVVAQVAGWPGGVAIPFVADMLSALLVTLIGLLVVACMVFARASGLTADPLFSPTVLVMTAGVAGAFLTADLFNLFVMIEVALLPSYVLMARSGGPRAARATRLYLTVNLTASTLLLAGLAAVYGTAGTLNLAALAGRGGEPVVAAAVGVVLVALAIKAAVVPVHTWLPATYPQTAPAVTALFSGLLTKVGVYALIRVVTLVYEPGPALTAVVVAVTAVTMVVGVLGALGESTMRGVLTFHMVSQTGYVLVGLGLAGAVGLSAAVFYMVQYAAVKAALFLAIGAVEVRRGTGVIRQLGGVAAEHRWVTVTFLLGALSLTGLPPFSGFWGKLGILAAAVEAGNAVAFATALLVSVGTMISMLKLGTGVFWGTRPEPQPASLEVTVPVGVAAATQPDADLRPAADRDRVPDQDARPAVLRWTPERGWPVGLVAPGLVLAVLSLAVGLYPEPLLVLAQTAGAVLADPTAYVQGVLGG